MERESILPEYFESGEYVYIPYAGETPTQSDVPASVEIPVDSMRANLPA
jgi:hypothetical protein